MRRWKRKGLTLFSLSQTCRSFRWEWRIMTCWWQSCTMTHQMMPSQPSVSTWLLKPVRPWWLITLIRNNEVVNLISHWSHCVCRCEWELDWDSLRNQLRGRACHRAASGDRWIWSTALPDLHCPPQPRHEDHALWKALSFRYKLHRRWIL